MCECFIAKGQSLMTFLKTIRVGFLTFLPHLRIVYVHEWKHSLSYQSLADKAYEGFKVV